MLECLDRIVCFLCAKTFRQVGNPFLIVEKDKDKLMDAEK